MEFGELRRAAVPAAGRTTLVGAAEAFKLITIASFLCAAVLVAGCASPTRTGATLDQLNRKIGGPGAGRTRIVITREKDIAKLVDDGWKVYLDGTVMGDLKSGTFVYRDRPAGVHKLSFSQPGDLARASVHEFVAASGRTYVYRLELNDKGKLIYGGAVVGGLSGWLVTAVIADAADKRGIYDFKLLEGAEAAQALADIHLAPEETKPR